MHDLHATEIALPRSSQNLIFKVYHLEEGKEGKDNIKPRFNDEDLEDHQPFPTLKAALEKLDEHVGFNIEIKWTMQLKASNHKLHWIFMNLYYCFTFRTELTSCIIHLT